ncbi:MAG TPA: S8 family serine peptidase [Gemmataceae bacterium]|nr:S8 family serine peptidase [Gemmataceae bacterium]
MIDPLEEIRGLWQFTMGHPEICIAVLDGPVDLTHPSLAGAQLTLIDCLETSQGGRAYQHGTHVASVIFGQHSGPVKGVAPLCRGLVIPVFASDGADGLGPCSQVDLARAIAVAVQHGARVINVSGGQFSPSVTADPLLARVVGDAAAAGALIVAAAGNDGCECLHVPAAVHGVLAVGAMTSRGEPLPFSNWGAPYERQGLLAPGENIAGAGPGGGSVCRSGTSFATAVVSGVAGLLLSVQRLRGREVSPARVRQCLLRTALGCDRETETDCRRLLAGRMDVKGALAFILRDETTMSEPLAAQAPEECPTINGRQNTAAGATPSQAAVARASGAAAGGDCACKSAAMPTLAYALGQLGYDLVSEARLDSLAQKIAGYMGSTVAERILAFDARKLLAYLDQNPWDAAAITWTLYLDGTPMYAIQPRGAFAADAYRTLREFLTHQLDEAVERVSIPGYLAGKTTLLLGQEVPVLVPALRGMYSWTTAELVKSVVGPAPAAEASQPEKDAHSQRSAGLRNFLERVYHAVRNLGLTPQERAINFAATNAFQIDKVYEQALREKMELDSINVVLSPICRPGSDCWDVELYFFFPERQVQTVRKVYRFTVDVSDVVPVTVGAMRSWFTR